MEISLPTYYPSGEVKAAGKISFKNGIDIWFSDLHTIKTLEEAENIARLISESLNTTHLKK